MHSSSQAHINEKKTLRNWIYSAIGGILRPIQWIKNAAWFRSEYRKFLTLPNHPPEFTSAPSYPCLWDRVDSSGEFGHYCYQDRWAFTHVLADTPNTLVDIASSVYFVAFSSAITKVIAVDIRKLDVGLPTIEFRRGDICALPFSDESIEMLSTLSVLEHIGLGRYGDPLDPRGMEKACKEVARVIKPGGKLLIAFPCGADNLVVFNAHRICTPEYSIGMFPGLTLVDEKYALANKIVDRTEYDILGRPYSYGCFAFVK